MKNQIELNAPCLVATPSGHQIGRFDGFSGNLALVRLEMPYWTPEARKVDVKTVTLDALTILRDKPEIDEDKETLVGAFGRFGYPIPVYDDGFGKLFVHRDSMGISGIVRARTWEDAYSICEDEFFPAGDEDAAEAMAEIEALPEGDKERDHLQACWDEAYGHRPNGSRRERDGSLSYIYAKDLNGESLDELTPELMAELEIYLEVRRYDEID